MAIKKASTRSYERKSGGPNKAQAIRDTIERLGLDHPTKSIVETLAGNGIEVSPAHVSNLKAKLRGANNGHSRIDARPAPTPTLATNGVRAARGAKAFTDADLPALFAAKGLVDLAGGLSKARAALDLLERVALVPA